MSVLLSRLSSLFQANVAIPAEHRRNFRFLLLEIAWFGLLNGSSLVFVSIYAVRLGATGTQIGFLSAIPAIVNLIFTLPAGKWLERFPITKSVFWSAFTGRFFYIFFVILPIMLLPEAQIWAIIGLTLIMNIPAVFLVIGLNTLFAESVPPEWRGYVAGLRNAYFSLTTVAVTYISGFILEKVEFPQGYQIVFLIGFVGAMVSTWLLRLVRPASQAVEKKHFPRQQACERNQPVDPAAKSLFHWEILRGRFGRVISWLFLFHLAQYLPIPLVPIYQVNYLHFSDQIIGAGWSAFYLAVFIGSIWVNKFTLAMGNRRATAFGIILLSFFPGLMIVSYTPLLLILTCVVGGIAWSVVSVALLNYLLEEVPADDRPVHLAWYNLALNLAILAGSLGGPTIASIIGFPVALFVFAIGRLLTGISILRWG